MSRFFYTLLFFTPYKHMGTFYYNTRNLDRILFNMWEFFWIKKLMINHSKKKNIKEFMKRNVKLTKKVDSQKLHFVQKDTKTNIFHKVLLSWIIKWKSFVLITPITPTPNNKTDLMAKLSTFYNLWPWYQWVFSLLTLILLYWITGHYYNKWLSDKGGWLKWSTRIWLISFDLSLNLALGLYYLDYRETMFGHFMLKCPIAISPVIFILELICLYIYRRWGFPSWINSKFLTLGQNLSFFKEKLIRFFRTRKMKIFGQRSEKISVEKKEKNFNEKFRLWLIRSFRTIRSIPRAIYDQILELEANEKFYDFLNFLLLGFIFLVVFLVVGAVWAFFYAPWILFMAYFMLMDMPGFKKWWKKKGR